MWKVQNSKLSINSWNKTSLEVKDGKIKSVESKLTKFGSSVLKTLYDHYQWLFHSSSKLDHQLEPQPRSRTHLIRVFHFNLKEIKIPENDFWNISYTRVDVELNLVELARPWLHLPQVTGFHRQSRNQNQMKNHLVEWSKCSALENTAKTFRNLYFRAQMILNWVRYMIR